MNEKSTHPKGDGLQVIGVGLPRTGTMSLYKALEILGFAPCHHFKHCVLDEPFPYTNSRRWRQIGDMTDDAAGRQALMRQIYSEGGFRAAVDYPTSLFVEDLVELYPDAKFVHGIRSSPEAWRKSFNDTIAKARGPLLYYSGFLLPFSQLSIQPLLSRFNSFNVHLHGIGIYEPVDGVEIYHRHNELVRRVVPKDQLLEFEPKMGWDPLCEFLGVPVPTDERGNRLEYPHANDTQEIQKGMRRALIAGVASQVMLIGTGYLTAKYLVLPLWRGL